MICSDWFGINTMSDISKNCCSQFYEPLGEWNLRQFWNITSGIYAKYHVQIMLLFVYTTTRKRFVIFTYRYFKLSWNTTALSQSNCRNFFSSTRGIYAKCHYKSCHYKLHRLDYAPNDAYWNQFAFNFSLTARNWILLLGNLAFFRNAMCWFHEWPS